MAELTLAQKIAQARAKLGSLQPDKKNLDQNYKYISADKILERAGDVLADLGIAIIPSVISESVNTVERQGGKSRIDAALKMSFQITDGTTEFIAHWTAWGSDYLVPDKAVYKAITSGHKYFLMKLLNVGVGNEDGEHEQAEQEEQRKPATQTPPAQKPAAQPTKPAEQIPDIAREGFITPALVVECGLAENDFAATEILRKLHYTSKTTAAYGLPFVRRYRALRDAGKTSDEAAAEALK